MYIVFKLGESYWKKTPYHEPTYYKSELQKISNNNIPIHSFYLNDYSFLKTAFDEISQATGGSSQFLDITNNQTASDTLTEVVTKKILFPIGGEEAVAEYDRLYVKNAVGRTKN